ncbi:hypothetical protein EYF80_064056 [Liparis tanakae]|uniref:Uncharacterized protein n=1 Tax=Liparis tanakae TaxID=230148 RepID=A0A4Z2EBY2_9TELE|nr:hypothetical protein EYF80_064056 [Liparis tanakae]
MDHGKRTVSSYFVPQPHDVEKTNPQNESHSDCEETVAAKKGRKFSFRDERLREFTWLRCFRETSSMNRTVCCRFPQHEHDTLIRHNAGLKHKMCRDLCDESAAPSLQGSQASRIERETHAFRS